MKTGASNQNDHKLQAQINRHADACNIILAINLGK